MTVFWVDRATAYYVKMDYDHALADYEKAVTLNPHNTEAIRSRTQIKKMKSDAIQEYIVRGISHATQNALDLALEDYNKAISLDPTYARAFDYRGDVYKSKGDLERAIADYSEAIRLDPQNDVFWIDRALTKKLKGDTVGAAADVAPAKQLDDRFHETGRHGTGGLFVDSSFEGV
jgi:tetratricopeptide (TPR) repeat protein